MRRSSALIITLTAMAALLVLLFMVLWTWDHDSRGGIGSLVGVMIGYWGNRFYHSLRAGP